MRSLRRRPRLALLGSALLVALLAALSVPTARAERDPWVHLVVLHTNDQHGALLPRTPAQAQVDATGPVGGYEALAAFVRNERAAAKAAGAHVLLVDGGDLWTGTPEGQLTRGDLPAEAMGRLGYDAIALGNHEFDLGLENAARLAKASAFPWISANVVEKSTGKAPAWLRPHVIREIDGLRIALVGLTTSSTPRIVVGGNAMGLDFLPEADAAERAVKDLGASADLVIFVTHCGPETDRAVLRRVTTVPLLIGGHSHTRLFKPILAREDGTGWIVQAGTQCVVAGRVRMKVHRDTKEVVLEEARLAPLPLATTGADEEARAFLRSRLDGIPELKALDEVVTTLEADLPRVGATPEAGSPAGNAITDAARAATGADIALHNRGAVRVSLPKGPVSRRDLWMLMPFDNTLVVLRMTGAQVRAALSFGVGRERVTPLEASGLEAKGVLEGAGVDLHVRWTSIRVGSEPLDDARVYRVAVNSFLWGGGDGYGVFAGPPAKDTGLRLRDVVMTHFARAQTFRPDTASRITLSR